MLKLSDFKTHGMLKILLTRKNRKDYFAIKDIYKKFKTDWEVGHHLTLYFFNKEYYITEEKFICFPDMVFLQSLNCLKREREFARKDIPPTMRVTTQAPEGTAENKRHRIHVLGASVHSYTKYWSRYSCRYSSVSFVPSVPIVMVTAAPSFDCRGLYAVKFCRNVNDIFELYCL